jgi:hypothetical protein
MSFADNRRNRMKAVLVVDIPDYIDDISKVELAYGLYFRKRFGGEPIDPTDILEYHEVYPLKPLPKRYEYYDINVQPEEIISNWEAVGWNACVDEIEREEEMENY